MYNEDELLPLSALQHILFCRRQCAFIHVEQIWVENRLTIEGQIMHRRVDSEESNNIGRVRVEYSMNLRSLQLGLIGKADVIEFHMAENEIKGGCKTKEGREIWRPFPVEYKRGRPKKDNCDRVQLCAQAICLEEMLGVKVPKGALFYGQTRRRVNVAFDSELRKDVKEAASSLHELINSGVTPKPDYQKKCQKCSFVEVCLPKTIGKASSDEYLMKAIEDI